MRMLMVCLGNICRSPIAEGVMKKMIADKALDWTVESAGTNGYHTGEAPHPHSQKICNRYAIDISTQRSRRFNRDDFHDFDKIYVMADDVYRDVIRLARNEQEKQKVIFFLDELHPGSKASVPDPWYGDEKGYLPVYQLIEQGCKAIIKKYSTVTTHV